jgi:hypothetical protein
MPYFNPLFAFLWYNGFIKTVNMYQLLVPGPAETLDMIFARRIPNADGTQSENFVINENLLSLFHFYVVCSLDASASIRRIKKDYFKRQIAYYKALTAAGVDWRAQLLDLLKLWAPEFKECTKKKRFSTDDTTAIDHAMQIDPRLL